MDKIAEAPWSEAEWAVVTPSCCVQNTLNFSIRLLDSTLAISLKRIVQFVFFRYLKRSAESAPRPFAPEAHLALLIAFQLLSESNSTASGILALCSRLEHHCSARALSLDFCIFVRSPRSRGLPSRLHFERYRFSGHIAFLTSPRCATGNGTARKRNGPDVAKTGRGDRF